MRGYSTSNLLVPMGQDFAYQNAEMWFINMDKLIKWVKTIKKINLFLIFIIDILTQENSTVKNITLCTPPRLAIPTQSTTKLKEFWMLTWKPMTFFRTLPIKTLIGLAIILRDLNWKDLKGWRIIFYKYVNIMIR